MNINSLLKECNKFRGEKTDFVNFETYVRTKLDIDLSPEEIFKTAQKSGVNSIMPKSSVLFVFNEKKSKMGIYNPSCDNVLTIEDYIVLEEPLKNSIWVRWCEITLPSKKSYPDVAIVTEENKTEGGEE